MSTEFTQWLRAQPSLIGVPPVFDLNDLPADPAQLFRDWIIHAAEAGVREPHAATLATVDSAGMPDARTLILKDLDDTGWAFAGLRSSAKGVQLQADPVAALAFWWQPLVRAVRVRGAVEEASPEESAVDLAARSAAARRGIVAAEWVRWRVIPEWVEFWQGSPDRCHIRIGYERRDGAWQHRQFSGATSG